MDPRDETIGDNLMPLCRRGQARMPEILLLSNLAEGINPGSSKSTVIGTEVPVRYRWFLATMVAILYLCFALAFSVYRVPMVV